VSATRPMAPQMPVSATRPMAPQMPRALVGSSSEIEGFNFDDVLVGAPLDN